MAEYIEKEAAVAVCSGRYKECLRKSDMCGDTVAWNIGFEIKQIPAADVAPVRHAEWVNERMLVGGFAEKWGCDCSACGATIGGPLWKPSYCPNCGAKMDLEVSE